MPPTVPHDVAFNARFVLFFMPALIVIPSVKFYFWTAVEAARRVSGVPYGPGTCCPSQLGARAMYPACVNSIPSNRLLTILRSTL
jgi:hypothetical protein